ncbi:MAG: cell envelope integrity protein TolA [Candidatus Handelsmanbacteria bacterium]|nr:cell envelope integrity protein TolA [Candidatus Handelsmanbacteria bacterium]
MAASAYLDNSLGRLRRVYWWSLAIAAGLHLALAIWLLAGFDP